MKYNLSGIMSHAWRMFRKLEISFSEALRRAWASAKAEPVNAERIAAAQAAAGIMEECNTWSGWQKLGFDVLHGSKALFGVDLICRHIGHFVSNGNVLCHSLGFKWQTHNPHQTNQ